MKEIKESATWENENLEGKSTTVEKEKKDEAKSLERREKKRDRGKEKDEMS